MNAWLPVRENVKNVNGESKGNKSLTDERPGFKIITCKKCACLMHYCQRHN